MALWVAGFCDLSLRATLLLGGTLEQRRRPRGISAALYIVRNKMAHGQHIADTVNVIEGEPKMPLLQLVISAQELLACVVKAVLAQGGLPNWRVVEIGV